MALRRVLAAFPALVTTEHARKRFGVFSEQAKELAALAQKVASEAAEPLKAGVTKAFQGHVS
jgi:hypothetical protein